MTISRREFIQVVAATAVAGPTLASTRLGAAGESFVRHASIGASGQAWADLESFATHPAFRLVAVADVDSARTAQVKARFPEARLYQDWRELLARRRRSSTRSTSRRRITCTRPSRWPRCAQGLHVYVPEAARGDRPRGTEADRARARATAC